jgi:outer membrane murein-binding lipoprotein Lpp
MDRPPDEPPTRATRPIGTTGAPVERTVPAEREVVLDPLLAEKIDSASFWSKVGSAIAVLAAIIGVIALILALDARNNDDNSGSTARLRSDIAELRSDVNSLDRRVSSARETSADATQLSTRVSRLQTQVQQLSGDLRQTSQDVTSLQQDLSQLSDRVDQVEQAQEDAAGGGP